MTLDCDNNVKFNLLNDSILPLKAKEGDRSGTLPEALARLCDGTLLGFDGLAAHQCYAWDLFLYQLAASALERFGDSGAVEQPATWRALADPAAWHERLAALTPGLAESAWSLIEHDVTKPAFLQPPIPAGNLGEYKTIGDTPDEIDVLITAKNHDVKVARAAAAEPWHWLFALVTLQTLQGYSGRGNFGIARMNGGFASRPLVMRTPGRDAATCFRRGVGAALRARAKALDAMHSAFAGNGTTLLWLEPWDREQGITTQRLDPLFIEVCRRVRLARDPYGRIVVWGRPSTTARVSEVKERKGDLGDAWTPITKSERAALTVGAGGFDYRLVSRLFKDEDFILPEGALSRPDDPADVVWLRCAVLVRGQGKTEGLHERWVRLPARAGRKLLGKLSQGMMLQARDAKSALSAALLNFLQGGPEKLNFKDRRADAALDSFEQEVDRVFFEHLFRRASVSEDDAVDAEADWKATLVNLARGLLDRATERMAPPQGRRERAQAIAALVLNGALRKAQLLPVQADPEEETHERLA